MRETVRHSDEPFAGRYVIERELGRGGMATVYRARDLRHDRAVALKVLHPEFAASVGGDRFSREIRMLASLHHPHILPLFDSGEHEGAVFYVVPCVEGESLRRRLDHERQLPLDEALRITREVADALDHANRNGVIHRDVKPENILLEEGHAIVADFGVARALTRAIGESSTTAGMVVGTPAYMSPEQASGDEALDGRSDQYSLACVLYEMLAGAPPFSGTTPRATIARRFTEPPPSLRGERDVPDGVDRAVRRALAPVPADRFVDATSFARALDAAMVPRQPRSRSLATLGIPAVGVIALALVIWWPRGGGADTLDPSLYAILPFAIEGRSPAGTFDGSAIARHLGRAMSFWQDMRLVDALRARDAVERHGRLRTLSDALAVARALGAGRLIWGDMWNRGDSIEVRAAMYDVRTERDERAARVMISAEVTNLAPVFDLLSDSLVLGNLRERSAAPAARDTRVREAFLQYEAGHRALGSWDLASAERSFRRATQLDPEFAQASLMLARVQVWKGAEPIDWRVPAAQAVMRRDQLNAREGAHADALLALANGRFPQACEQYRAMIARDSLDFAAWHGLATCQARDPIVERDPRSPSGWRFRGSLHAGLAAYIRAMEVLPSFHRTVLQISPFPTELFPLDEATLRVGYAVERDTLRFAAAAGLDADTLTFVPYPFKQVIAGAGGSWPATHASAIAWARERFRRVTESWVRAFPGSRVARGAHAAALEAVGDLNQAIVEARQARALSVDDVARTRLVHDEVRLLVKRGDFEDARHLADSILAARGTPPYEESHWLAGLAALTGRVHRTRALLELDAEDSTFAFWDGGERITAPRPVSRTALALLAYASFPDQRDSALALTRRLRATVGAWAAPPQRQRVLTATMTNPIMFGLWQLDPALARSLGGQEGLQGLERSLATGDTASVRAVARSIRADTSERYESDPDHALQTALVFLAAGDTAAATLLLDRLLKGLATNPRWLLEDVHRAAAIPVAMRTRAVLAARARDSVIARRWAESALTLWRNADPELRPFLQPLDALTGNPD